MGRRGRLPMPPHLRLLKGSPGGPGRAKPQVEAMIAPEPPAAPSWLTGYALEQWHTVVGELHKLGLLSVLDLMPFCAYCVSYGRWRSASEALAQLPESERLVVGDRPQPLLKIIRDSAAEMQRIGAAFGLSGPASRARLAGHGRQSAGKSKFSGYIGGEPA
jgi:P27 family predicted phage terminase small subunit